MNVLYAQGKEGKKDDDRLLFIPGNIINNGEFIHIVKVENFLQLQGNEGQTVGIIALPRIQHPGNAADGSQIQLVIFILGTAGSQNHCICWKGFCKMTIIFPASCPSITAGHDNEFLNSAGLHCLHHRICQSKHLVMGETAGNKAFFDFLRPFAGKGLTDNRSEIFSAVLFINMAGAGEGNHTGGPKSSFIAVLGRHHAVGGHEDRTVKGFEFLPLFPPCIAVVPGKMAVFLKERIVMGRKHFPMSIHVHTGPLCLFQKHL